MLLVKADQEQYQMLGEQVRVWLTADDEKVSNKVSKKVSYISIFGCHEVSQALKWLSSTKCNLFINLQKFYYSLFLTISFR